MHTYRLIKLLPILALISAMSLACTESQSSTQSTTVNNTGSISTDATMSADPMLSNPLQDATMNLIQDATMNLMQDAMNEVNHVKDMYSIQTDMYHMQPDMWIESNDQTISTMDSMDQFQMMNTLDQGVDPMITPSQEWILYADENWDAIKEISLGEISAGTDCAAFVSAVLRHFGFDVWAVYTDGLATGDSPDQTLAYRLFELGFERYDYAELLEPGDICFSIDAYYEGVEAIDCEYEVSQRDGWFPTHTYFFMEWENPGQTDYAWVVDNQGRKHLRNMTVPGARDPFQYFMRLE